MSLSLQQHGSNSVVYDVIRLNSEDATGTSSFQTAEAEAAARPSAESANTTQEVSTLRVMLWLHVKYNYFKNYFSLRRRPSAVILFQRVETCLKLFQNYFTGLLQLTNIIQHVRRR